MDKKIEALGSYFAAILMEDYRAAILKDDFHYIYTHPVRHLLRILYLCLLQSMALLLSHTKAAPAAVYVEIYYLTALILTAVIWKRSGYSLLVYGVINALCLALLLLFLG